LLIKKFHRAIIFNKKKILTQVEPCLGEQGDTGCMTKGETLGGCALQRVRSLQQKTHVGIPKQSKNNLRLSTQGQMGQQAGKTVWVQGRMCQQRNALSFNQVPKPELGAVGSILRQFIVTHSQPPKKKKNSRSDSFF
jgi:hypothetical protein